VSASDARSWFPADIDRTATAPVAGPVPGGELIHQRAYEIGSYFEDDDHFRLVGHVRDVKPDGMWGIQDTEPMVVHHMELHLVVHAATMTITQVFTKMHVTPQLQCVDIEASYQQLAGLPTRSKNCLVVRAAAPILARLPTRWLLWLCRACGRSFIVVTMRPLWIPMAVPRVR
jgi:hypothetical protein